MSEYGDRAKALFESGYNCSQSVVLAFCEPLGLDPEQMAKLSSSFGGGMGRLREVCGAVSGMLMILGLEKGYTSPQDREGKIAQYALVQKAAGAFRESHGSIVCRELLGLSVHTDEPVPEERTPEYYKKRPCGELIRHAAELTARELGLT